jgi:integral membrane protein (TIGR01906 family)
MKILKAIVFWLFICCVPLLVIASNLRWGINEIRVYEYGVDKYEISYVTRIDKPELMNVYQHLIDYYNSEVDSAQVIVEKEGRKIAIFNEKELIHLSDVKNLVQLDYVIQVAALLILLVCCLALLIVLKARWPMLANGFLWGSVVTLGLMIFLALWAVFGFEQLFVLFHRLSFTNEFWILDPGADYLIMLFPGGFFYDIALFGFAAVIIESLFLGAIAFIILKLEGKTLWPTVY